MPAAAVRRTAERGHHAVEQRQRERGAEAAQEPCGVSGIAFLVMIMILCSASGTGALDDAEHDGRPAVVGRRGVPHDFPDRRIVVVLDAAAERVGQQLLGHGRRRSGSGLLQEQRPQPGHGPSNAPPVGMTPEASIGVAAPPSSASSRWRRSSRARTPAGPSARGTRRTPGSRGAPSLAHRHRLPAPPSRSSGPARPAAEAAAVRRAGCRAPTCPAAPATCGWDTT